jgi:arginase
MRLIDGAEAIKGDLPSRLTVDVETPIGAGTSLGTGIHRLSSVISVRDRLTDALAALEPGDTPLVVGGDCGVELGAIGHALRTDPDVCVVWFDAHGDLNTAESSPSSAFSGMVLRTVLGDADPLVAPETALQPGRAVLVGARALDDGEVDYIESTGIALVPAEDAAAQTVVDAVAATGASSVYLHVDLDVLDPADIAGVSSAEPFGMRMDAVLAALTALRQRFTVVGGSILGFAPESPAAAGDDLPSILRILSAITSTR